ncbi:hypothetical protein M6I34_06045 [Burkholderiaceae bacterium FT117]|uniref:hypothetical protein n=1 Tax=Zeimonas sediminis TaxID=2944268 RepID=UPI002342DC68|nr:hypothetical protein [Zeimonas sediminis]MCM5570062.1 hypothetical protein [Zeimonas sediminis]
MSKDGDEVRSSLAWLTNDELVSQIRSGNLTEDARRIAEELLVERGAAALRPHVKPAAESDLAFLSRCFRGEASLNDAFWVLGFGIGLTVWSPVFLVGILLNPTSTHTFSGAVVSSLLGGALFGTIGAGGIGLLVLVPTLIVQGHGLVEPLISPLSTASTSPTAPLAVGSALIAVSLAAFAATIFRDFATWRCASNSKTVFMGVVARVWIFFTYVSSLIALLLVFLGSLGGAA